MKPKHFLLKVDDPTVISAITQAEHRTSGQINVFVSHHKVADPVAAARKYFARMHLDRTALHNGVLIFVAPKTCNFAIIGDQAIHEKCGSEFWNQVATEMTDYFKQQQWTQALVHGIAKAGDLLAVHFPPRN